MAKWSEQPAGSPEDDARDETIGRLINEFFDRRESGENLTEDAFISEHAEFADDLRDHLGGLDLLRGIGGSSGRDPLNNDTLPADVPGRGNGDDLRDIPLPKIDGYEMQRAIGRGGMGVVFKAIQTNTRRQVALKVLLEGPFATGQSRKRFEREISLSAQLRHPHIIPIYDSGTFDGRMYYAMEYVRGMPLDEWAAKTNPTVREKLSLFSKVCEAMRHAHQRGVIHRDMKPSNILVQSDGKPNLLDFGLAKQGTFGDMTTSLTAQIIGTPAYMSPEQAAGDPSGIDVRTDVYSLGVVLYELLTNQMPYDTKSSMGQLLNHIARTEADESHLQNAGLDSEVCAIVMKALEKSKDERYQSVDALMADIQRYLNDEPISVRTGSGVYLLTKALRKHRRIALVFLLGLLPLALVAYGVQSFSSVWQRTQDRLEQQEKRLAEQEERLQLERELQRQREIELEQKKREAEQQLIWYEKMVGSQNAEIVRQLTSGNISGAVGNLDLDALTANMQATPVEQEQPGKDLSNPFGSLTISDPVPTALIPAPPEKDDEQSQIGAGLLRTLKWLGSEPAKKGEPKPPATSQPAATSENDSAANEDEASSNK